MENKLEQEEVGEKLEEEDQTESKVEIQERPMMSYVINGDEFKISYVSKDHSLSIPPTFQKDRLNLTCSMDH